MSLAALHFIMFVGSQLCWGIGVVGASIAYRAAELLSYGACGIALVRS